MVDAIFLDFYGTVVWEDGEAIDIISRKIHKSGNSENISGIGYYWWKEFQNLCTNSYGNNFQTQRILEKISLEHTIKNFSSSEEAKSYKPRKEIFEMALKETGLVPNQVLHVGDSLNSDVYGGNALFLWNNSIYCFLLVLFSFYDKRLKSLYCFISHIKIKDSIVY